MTEATTVATPPAGVTPATPTPAGAQTSPATSSEGATPQTPVSTFDWNANLDQVPWDKVDIKNIEKIPGVSKMQRTFMGKIKDMEQRAQAEIRAMQAQLQQYQQIVAGQYPEMGEQFQQIQAMGEQSRLQAQLEEYQRRDAIRALSQQYGVDEEFFLESPPQDPTEALMRVAEYHRNKAMQVETGMAEKLNQLQRQLDALKNQRNDPAANADVGAAAVGGNTFQTEWEALIKEGRFKEADNLRRAAEGKGVEINVSRLRPPGWT